MSVLEEISTGALTVVLGSKSPRRKELLKLVIPEFEVQSAECEEVYPAGMKGGAIAVYLSQLKSSAFSNKERTILLITADTIVWMNDRIYEKPKSETEARLMLGELSGKRHSVFTGVTLRRGGESHSFVSETVVEFGEFTLAAISDYVHKFQPLDKAGSYGIQDCVDEEGEQIGPLPMTLIEGSYTNVIGLPVEELKTKLSQVGLI